MTRLAKFSMKRRLRPVVAGVAVAATLGAVTTTVSSTPAVAAPVYTSDINVVELDPGTVMAPVGPKNNLAPVAGMVTVKGRRPVPHVNEVAPDAVVSGAVLVSFPASTTRVTFRNSSVELGAGGLRASGGEVVALLDTTFFPNGPSTIAALSCSAPATCVDVTAGVITVDNPISPRLEVFGPTAGVRDADGAVWEADDDLRIGVSPSEVPGVVISSGWLATGALNGPRGPVGTISTTGTAFSPPLPPDYLLEKRVWASGTGTVSSVAVWIGAGNGVVQLSPLVSPLSNLEATNARTRFNVTVQEVLGFNGKTSLGAPNPLTKGAVSGPKLRGQYVVNIVADARYLPAPIYFYSQLNDSNPTDVFFERFPSELSQAHWQSVNGESYVIDTTLLTNGHNTLYVGRSQTGGRYLEPYPFLVDNGADERVLMLRHKSGPPEPIKYAKSWTATDTIELSNAANQIEIDSSDSAGLVYSGGTFEPWQRVHPWDRCDIAVTGKVSISLDGNCTQINRTWLPRIDAFATGVAVVIQPKSITVKGANGVPVTYGAPVIYKSAKNPDRSCIPLGC